jgi:hypothetical protein
VHGGAGKLNKNPLSDCKDQAVLDGLGGANMMCARPSRNRRRNGF